MSQSEWFLLLVVLSSYSIALVFLDKWTGGDGSVT